ncbi:MAG: CBS domain-containing protein [Eubacteriales bacterium]|nr:CBS domain-containing protein [Eubacteriales bacterium]
MNILFFLTPKSEVAYVREDDTLRQALEKMEHHGYAAVPLLSVDGKYIGTITDGDVLWGLKNMDFPSLHEMEDISVMEVRRSRDNKPVHVDVGMEGLLEKVSVQNFVPVIDDEKVFIGIVTRRDIIHHLMGQRRAEEEQRRLDGEEWGKSRSSQKNGRHSSGKYARLGQESGRSVMAGSVR